MKRLDAEHRHVQELTAMNEATRAALDRAVASERALAAEKDRLAITLRSIGDAVISTGASGRVVVMNVVAEALSGLAHKDAIGLPLAEVMKLIDPETGQPDAGLSADLPLLPEGPARALLVSPAGNVSTLERRTSPIFDSDGVLCGAVWVFRDITDLVALEEERLKASKLESLGILAGGIAHDFNNILTAILGNIYLAKDDAAPPTREVLEEAERACVRARALTNQLLTFSKGGTPVRTAASIGGMIRESASFVVRGSAVKCECTIAPDLWEVDADVGQLAQVVQNLVINAKQSTADGGVVSIEAVNLDVAPGGELTPTLAPGRYVRIDVVDQGCGIPETVLPKIFDPYFTTKPRSTGLGLATAYSILKAHHGHISVRSTVDVGTHVRVYLPASATRRASSAVSTAIRPGVRSAARVLVMDDEEAIRRVATRLLSRMGHEVEAVPDGAAAIDAFAQARLQGRPFDLVLMDLTVPGAMGGVEAMTHLRAMDPAVRALVSSGYADSNVIAEYARYGFCGVVTKPFILGDLRNAIDRALSPTAA